MCEIFQVFLLYSDLDSNFIRYLFKCTFLANSWWIYSWCYRKELSKKRVLGLSERISFRCIWAIFIALDTLLVGRIHYIGAVFTKRKTRWSGRHIQPITKQPCEQLQVRFLRHYVTPPHLAENITVSFCHLYDIKLRLFCIIFLFFSFLCCRVVNYYYWHLIKSVVGFVLTLIYNLT